MSDCNINIGCLKEILQNGNINMKPVQLQIIATQYDTKLKRFRLQLSDTVYKSHSVFLKTDRTDAFQQNVIIKITDYILHPVKMSRPNHFENYQMYVTAFTDINDKYLTQIGSPEFLTEHKPLEKNLSDLSSSDVNIEHSESVTELEKFYLENFSLVKEEEIPLVQNEEMLLVREEEISGSSDFVDSNQILQELMEIDQRNSADLAARKENASELSLPSALPLNEEENQQWSTTGQSSFTDKRKEDTSQLDAIMDDDDKLLLLQIPQEVLDNNHTSMMNELFFYLEKDMQRLKDELCKVTSKKVVLDRELVNVMKDKQNVQKSIDIAEKELLKINEKISKLNSLVAEVKAKRDQKLKEN